MYAEASFGGIGDSIVLPGEVRNPVGAACIRLDTVSYGFHTRALNVRQSTQTRRATSFGDRVAGVSVYPRCS